MSPVLLIMMFGLVALWLGWRWALKKCEAANVADWGNRWINRLDGLNRIFCRRFHRLNHVMLPLPKRGGALVASNHVSGLDPLLLIAASPRPLRFIIAREQYERRWLKWLFHAVGCIPVGRSRHLRAALEAARQALAAGEVVALFPHGRIHFDRHAPAPLKRGVALLASAAGVPVVPVRLEGVRGQGRVMTAVFLRSRVRIVSYPALYPLPQGPDSLLNELARLLSD